jgi:hypothetical protein
MMKRPAAQLASSTGPSPKKRLLPRRAEGVFSTFSDALNNHLPTSALIVLAGIIEKYAPQGDGSLVCEAPLQDYEKKAMSLASKALTSLEAKLYSDVREARAKLEQTESEKIARVTALETAEAGVVAQLEAVNKNAFQPLRQASVQGSTDKKKLLLLQNVGKRLEFHDVLLNTTMPKVLMKRLEKRQTFDRFVLDQVELEFDKKRLQLENSLQDQESAKRALETVAFVAKQNMVDSEQQRSAKFTKLKEAEASLKSFKKSVLLARRALKNIEIELLAISDNLSRTEVRLDAFCNGLSCAFQKLEMAILSPSDATSFDRLWTE